MPKRVERAESGGAPSREGSAPPSTTVLRGVLAWLVCVPVLVDLRRSGWSLEVVELHAVMAAVTIATVAARSRPWQWTVPAGSVVVAWAAAGGAGLAGTSWPPSPGVLVEPVAVAASVLVAHAVGTRPGPVRPPASTVLLVVAPFPAWLALLHELGATVVPYVPLTAAMALSAAAALDRWDGRGRRTPTIAPGLAAGALAASVLVGLGDRRLGLGAATATVGLALTSAGRIARSGPSASAPRPPGRVDHLVDRTAALLERATPTPTPLRSRTHRQIALVGAIAALLLVRVAVTPAPTGSESTVVFLLRAVRALSVLTLGVTAWQLRGARTTAGAAGATVAARPRSGARVPHPADLLLGLVVTAVAAAQLRFIWVHRGLGNLDVDESAFVAEAVRTARTLRLADLPGGHQLAFGPILPTLSGLSMVVGPLDPRWAMSIQPLFAAVVALCAAAIARRFVGRATAAAAGIGVALLPATLAASQIYLTSLAAAAAVTATVLTVLTCDGGTRRRVWLLGPLLAAVPLSRAMAAAFVPGILVGLVLVTRDQPRGRRRALASVAVAGLFVSSHLLGPGAPTIGYLTGGLAEPTVQDVGLLGRIGVRFDELGDGFGWPLLPVALLAALAGVVHARRRRPGALEAQRRELSALTSAAAGGVVLLVGGDFGGLGFWDYPLMPTLAVALVVAFSLLPRPVVRALGVAALGWLAYLALVGLWVLPPSTPAEWAMSRYRTSLFQPKNGYDPRMSDPHDRSLLARASAEWWDVVERTDDRIRALDAARPGPLEVIVLAGTNYVGPNHDLLALLDDAESMGPVLTARPTVTWEEIVGDDPGRDRIVLVPTVSRSAPGRPDGRTPSEWRAARRNDVYRRAAAAAERLTSEGWTTSGTLPLPLGDRFVVYRRPPTSPSASGGGN